MKKLFFASAAALAFASAPALADNHRTAGADGPEATTSSVGDKRGFEMSDAQRGMYDSWPADRRASYDAWEPERQMTYFGWTPDVQTYYWQLEPAQQEAWWYLNDSQRMQVYNLTPEQRQMAWTSIQQQVSQMPGNASGSSAVNEDATSPSSRQREMASSAPMADQPAEYPVCTSEVQDSCINAWAAGKRGPGVARPLDRWPGEPASS